jgi:hypothetical protein
MKGERLRELLDKSEKDKLSRIEKHVAKIFEKNTVFHPFYTLHGVGHSEAVIEKLGELTKNLMVSPKRLNSCEVFCLLASAYLHDTGMLCPNPDDEATIDQMKMAGRVPETYQVSDLVRREHHLRSEKYIRKYKESLGINHVEASTIGKISRGHRKENLNVEYYDDSIIGGPSIRVRLLAALLRLADELDADFRRAPVELRKLLEMDMDLLDRIHWIKHYCTEGIKLDEKTETGLQVTTITPHLIVPNKIYGKKYIIPLVADPIKRKLHPSAGAEYIGEILAWYGIVIRLEKPKIKTEPELEVIPPEIFEKGIYMMSTECSDLLFSFEEARILEAARMNGYFEVPKRITIEELADSLGMNSAVLSNRLISINRRVFDDFLREWRLEKEVTE